MVATLATSRNLDDLLGHIESFASIASVSAAVACSCRSGEAMVLLQSYYTAARSASADAGQAEASSALLLSLLRLSMAAARLSLRSVVSVRDAMLAVRVAEESQQICSGPRTVMLLGQSLSALCGSAGKQIAGLPDAEVDIDQHLNFLVHAFCSQSTWGENEE
jgi:MCM AAA-lid domain